MSKLPKNTEIAEYHLHKNQTEILQFEIYPLKQYLAESGTHAQIPHIHSFYQIIWFTQGTGNHYIDFNQFQVSPNTIFFISKNQIHYFDNNPDYQGFIIHFNESFLMDNQTDINLFLKHNLFNSFEKEPFFKIENKAVTNFNYLISQMQQETENTHLFAHKDYLKHLLNLFLIQIQRIGKRKDCNGLSINTLSNIIFVKFRQLVETNFKNIHTVNAYADMFHISTKILTNYTKEISTKTPLEIITDRITLEAKCLLSHSGLNINQIAYQLGFQDPSYFVKFFKKQTHLSPNQFRKTIS
ncbi:MAG: AraC family transcriptional regulator [Odoribacter sp.]|nr:AraC family transcriptional regulator [Odoribacter sp.]